eukprot:TRINITY_DN346_c6_g1_i1.p1 TRINITY_DN346_c6_g1~~TRINITY_DN346_c6_g1_i1.p1  ORF type:complete len:634 (+),score=120.03 TRINITY_DN346_c6_g1_i1:51-1952(+)
MSALGSSSSSSTSPFCACFPSPTLCSPPSSQGSPLLTVELPSSRSQSSSAAAAASSSSSQSSSSVPSSSSSSFSPSSPSLLPSPASVRSSSQLPLPASPPPSLPFYSFLRASSTVNSPSTGAATSPNSTSCGAATTSPTSTSSDATPLPSSTSQARSVLESPLRVNGASSPPPQTSLPTSLTNFLHQRSYQPTNGLTSLPQASTLLPNSSSPQSHYPSSLLEGSQPLRKAQDCPPLPTFLDISYKKRALQDLISSVQRVQSHEGPAPFDHVKLIIVFGAQQFYPRDALASSLARQRLSRKEFQHSTLFQPDSLLRSEFSSALPESSIKELSRAFRDCSSRPVSVRHLRGLDLYLNDHELAVGVRVRFEILEEPMGGSKGGQQRSRLRPLTIKTTNARPFVLTAMSPAGVLDFRIELAARYHIDCEESDEFREVWDMARGCLWSPAQPSMVWLPRRSLSRFSVRRVKFWEDALLMGEIPTDDTGGGLSHLSPSFSSPPSAAFSPLTTSPLDGFPPFSSSDTGLLLPPSPQEQQQAASQREKLEVQLAVTKHYDKKRLSYSVIGSCPQMDSGKQAGGTGSKFALSESSAERIFDFCTKICSQAATFKSSLRREANGSINRTASRAAPIRGASVLS